MTTPVHDDDFTELVDADIPRVDLVDKAANGLRFLIAKRGDAGLIDPATVRDLIGKTRPDTPTDDRETVTMTGSPGAIAKLIHQAALTTQPVTKDVDVADVDLTTALAEPESGATGLATTPGSPAWEAIDAATACKWTSVLARAKAAVGLLAERELLEAAAGDGDDAMQAMDLEDACAAIDYAISVLAPFAVAEQTEAEIGDDMAAVGKALAGFDTAPLDTIEGLNHIRKAGRVLSAANESAIRGAVESLQRVLTSLPAAPTAPDIAKTANEEPNMPTVTLREDVSDVAGQEPAMGTAEIVEKADGDAKPSMRAVYDAKGRLVGIVDPADITPIEDADPAPDDAAADPAATEEPAAETDAMPPAEVGTPADAVPDDGVAKTQNTQDAEMLKSIAAAMAKEQLDKLSAGQQEVIAKQAETIAALTNAVELLKGQVNALEEQPAQPKVFTRGAVPPAHQMRGQDRGAAPVDVTKAAELKQTLYKGSGPEQNQAATDMQALAIARLQQIHHGQR